MKPQLLLISYIIFSQIAFCANTEEMVVLKIFPETPIPEETTAKDFCTSEEMKQSKLSLLPKIEISKVLISRQKSPTGESQRHFVPPIPKTLTIRQKPLTCLLPLPSSVHKAGISNHLDYLDTLANETSQRLNFLKGIDTAINENIQDFSPEKFQYFLYLSNLLFSSPFIDHDITHLYKPEFAIFTNDLNTRETVIRHLQKLSKQVYTETRQQDLLLEKQFLMDLVAAGIVSLNARYEHELNTYKAAQGTKDEILQKARAEQLKYEPTYGLYTLWGPVGTLKQELNRTLLYQENRVRQLSALSKEMTISFLDCITDYCGKDIEKTRQFLSKAGIKTDQQIAAMLYRYKHSEMKHLLLKRNVLTEYKKLEKTDFQKDMTSPPL